ncbi:NUDIX hydrolase [Cellulomonas sp.]|uniref:NUDIX hydrolase n=1 Tax=Cellulomonas sp. TaxID=40001 RepID=UPI002D777E8B|nr:NUDIX hydrolase [Cellulomonas sp.]
MRPDAPARRIVTATPDAPWLPPGGLAEVVADPGGHAPAPTGLVRLLVRRHGRALCVPRSGSGKVDLPTRPVPDLGDGRGAAEDLAGEVLGTADGLRLVGYVRNVVAPGAEDYPWPTPVAHFAVWEAEGDPQVPGSWVPLDGPVLRDRHWWPLAGGPV